MRKNLTALLHKGNLTPKERFSLFINNSIIKYKTGKEPLSQADINALENWQAKTNEEVREWNKYREALTLTREVEIQSKLTFLITSGDYYRKKIISTELSLYPFYREYINDLNQIKKIKPVDIKEAIEITNKQREQKLKDGLAFETAVYNLAFENLDENLRKDILALYDDAETEPDYLDQEEIIADLYNSKDELTKEAKEKLAELVGERAEKKGINNYFACIPIIEVAKKWVKEKGIKIPKEYEVKLMMKEAIIEKMAKKEKRSKDEIIKDLFFETGLEDILEQYARDNKTTIKAIIKENCLKWLDEGLLAVENYQPIFNSDKHNTYGADTKLPHEKVFKGWLQAKKQAKMTLQGLIDKGELEQMGQDKTITGESLYNFKGDYKFIKDFKKRVDEYDAELGGELLICERDEKGKAKFDSIFGKAINTLENHFETLHFFKETEKDGNIFLEFKDEDTEKGFKEMRDSLIKGYATLLAYKEMYIKLAKIFMADLTITLERPLEDIGRFIDEHNFLIENITADTAIFGYKKRLQIKDDLFINKDKILPDINESESWSKKFEDILGDEF